MPDQTIGEMLTERRRRREHFQREIAVINDEIETLEKAAKLCGLRSSVDVGVHDESKAKPYHCDADPCGKSFPSLQGLNVHRSRMHGLGKVRAAAPASKPLMAPDDLTGLSETEAFIKYAQVNCGLFLRKAAPLFIASGHLVTIDSPPEIALRDRLRAMPELFREHDNEFFTLRNGA